MRRANLIQFEHVEKAIELADQGLTSEAAKICSLNNIPIEVAHRVITKPHQRRDKKKFLENKIEAVWRDVEN